MNCARQSPTLYPELAGTTIRMERSVTFARGVLSKSPPTTYSLSGRISSRVAYNQDLTIRVINSSDIVVGTNDNWKDTQQSRIQATALAPADDRESAILAILPAGSYTAIVSGVNGMTGIALVEVSGLN